jgi:hypothetical protein
MGTITGIVLPFTGTIGRQTGIKLPKISLFTRLASRITITSLTALDTHPTSLRVRPIIKPPILTLTRINRKILLPFLRPITLITSHCITARLTQIHTARTILIGQVVIEFGLALASRAVDDSFEGGVAAGAGCEAGAGGALVQAGLAQLAVGVVVEVFG